ncbi:MAG: HAD family hydrolase, partial [Erysipelotrichaceae bacterium]|nr:HAD family hydrolase [Erysipelotrichaceae bacterium]
GVEEFLNYLVEKKLPFTIASASIKENIDFFVSSFKLDKWLDPNLIVYDDGNYATKVEMFNEAAKRLDVDIKECLVVEDSISGIEFAHQCDVAKIIAINSDKDKEKYQEFDYLTDILDDFTTFPYDIFEMEH